MSEKGGYIYIISNKARTVLYIGVTSDLANRIFEHKEGKGSVFAARYKCKDLVYYESYKSIEEAIIREKRLKKWKREWKEQLIKKLNPNLIDLYLEIKHLR